MSELKNIIDNMILDKVESRATIVKGKIVDFNEDNSTYSVELSNPVGGGVIVIKNLLPPFIPGMSYSSIQNGAVAILNVPQGNFTYAQLVSIRPENEDPILYSNKIKTTVPRTGKMFSTRI